jgi:hypothetical protein
VNFSYNDAEFTYEVDAKSDDLLIRVSHSVYGATETQLHRTPAPLLAKLLARELIKDYFSANPR